MNMSCVRIAALATSLWTQVVLVGCGGDAALPVAGESSQPPQSENVVSPEPPQENAAPEMELATAALEGDLEAIQQHIKAKTDLDKNTPLVTAVVFGNVEAAKLLMDAGADLDAKDTQGSTPLFCAALFGRTEILKLLLEKGADRRIPNKDGTTPEAIVKAPFEAVKPALEYLERQLAPLGLKLDYVRLQKARPEIARILESRE